MANDSSTTPLGKALAHEAQRGFWKSPVGLLVAVAALGGAIYLASFLKKRGEIDADSGSGSSGDASGSLTKFEPSEALVVPLQMTGTSPKAGELLAPGTEVVLSLQFNKPIKSCHIGGVSATASGKSASAKLPVPYLSNKMPVAWSASTSMGEKASGELGYPVKEEKFVTVTAVFKTGAEDKECGEALIRISQNSGKFFERGYGHKEDGDCNSDDTWKSDSDPISFSENLGSAPIVDGSPLTASLTLEERSGEVNILWNGSVTITLTTSAGRRATWTGSKPFDTNGGNITYDKLELGAAELVKP